ncbi:hypothetical protein CLOM_g19067 [Closterium sp. NIES-68]|nr:hypothetical protein CLOM_g19067 [Closterium sp. NIES-68]GJP62348.1 hypothetical protein CLOP_g19426 [Closterium sp. NIES-67]
MATASNALSGHHGLRLGRLQKDQKASLLSLRHDRKASFSGSGKMQASSSRSLRLVATATVPQSQATSLQSPSALAINEDAPINFDDLGFGLVETDYMFVAKCARGEEWEAGELRPYGNLEMSPAAGVLNYGQGVFEGMKAYRTADGRVLLFRPRANAKRMQESADRLSMPAPPVEQFVKAVEDTVLANLRWVPPCGKGALYIRPLLVGSGPVLGLAPAPEYSFLIYVSPVGNYFKGATLTPISLKVEEHYHRAAPGGTGSAKAIGNYSPVLKTQIAAKQDGFSDVVYLDAQENKYIEEVSSCNIFVVKDNVISTPDLRGTILAGITRRSILELAQALGYKAEERQVSIEDLLGADEVFCTGTAVVLSPVGAVTFRGEKTTFGSGEAGKVSQLLYERLTNIQKGVDQDTMGWTVQIA